MSIYTKEYTDAGVGPEFSIAKGNSFTYDISGTFDLHWVLQQTSASGGWKTLFTSGTTASGTLKAEVDTRYRIVAHTPGDPAGTMVVTITELVDADRVLRILPAARGKVGTTAGWAPAAANNLSLATLPASQTASTLVIPVEGLRVGDKITGFYATGQVESAGNAVTFNLALRRMTAAAADVTDASVAAITQLSVTEDTILSSTNTRADDLNEVVGVDESFYFLVTGTTLGSTDIALQSVTLEIKE